jgi:hypothetical protein
MLPRLTPLVAAYEPDLPTLIDALLQRLANDPGNPDLHRELRETALRRKVAGGPPLGVFAHIRPLPRDPLRRLIHVEWLWSFDPGNMKWLGEVALAVEACAAARSGTDFEPVRRWLRRMLNAASAGDRSGVS